MLELIAIYKVTIVAGMALAAALALLGCQLAARDRAMETLCVAQGATLGVLFGIGIIHFSPEAEARVHYPPLISGFLFSVGTFVLADKLLKRKRASRNTYYTGIFVSLLAACSLVAAAFPALESHMAQVFFGDLATITDRDAWITLFIGALSMGVLIAKWKETSNQSFELAVLGSPVSEKLFNALSILLLCFSVQFVGFLFTAAALFIPTVILNFSSRVGIRYHLSACAVAATGSSLIGFLLSLHYTRFPTVPTIVLTMIFFCTFRIGLEKMLTPFSKRN